jgi:hypothetical protein
MTIAQAQQIAADIAEKSPIFQCFECAIEIAKKIRKTVHATFERLRTLDNTDVICLRTEDLAISVNRIHLGIRIGDIVFDNIHHAGVPAIEWPRRFMSPVGDPLVHEARPIAEFFGRIFLVKEFRQWASAY